MASGYIKLYRSSLNDPLYLKEPFTKWQAWCDLILLAYFAPSEFFVRGIRVKAKRGCVYKGALELAERWQWSRGKVNRFLSYLEEDKRIGIQKSRVVSCISIVNYDKFQQSDTTNDTTNETSNGTTNESLIIKNNKKTLNNIPPISPTSQDCDGVGLGENTGVIGNLLVQMDELKKRLDALDNKSNEKKKKKTNPLITKGKEVFERKYSDLFDGDYYWQAKDAVAMDALIKKIVYSRQQRGMGVEDEDVLNALKAFLDSIKDPWLLKNFSMTSINGKYNEIVAQARASQSNGNGNQSSSVNRAQDAANVISSLAAKEGDNAEEIW